MSFSEIAKKRFDALQEALGVGFVHLLDCRRRSDQKSVAVICIAVLNSDEYVDIYPVAEMIDDENPTELYDFPKPDGEYESEPDGGV